ncbi:MAG: M28 family peptidase [Candidatus Hodarchaeales archaeon]|jgi:hypothetical protein
MNQIDIINQIDIERIYKHILNLEGIRHPVTNVEGLNQAADYITNELNSYGLKTVESPFNLDGLDLSFTNIEGVINEKATPELIVTSHYDTVLNTPGADDNSSGCAVMLEVARVLKEVNIEKTVRFISFTLEEGNPVYQRDLLIFGKELGLLDYKNRFKSYHTHKIMKKHKALRKIAISEGKNPRQSWQEATETIKNEITPEELKYLDKGEKTWTKNDFLSWIGETALIGSDIWAKKARNENKEILGVINLEMIGYTSTKPHSQTFPKGVNPKEMKLHKVNLEEDVGNFIGIISDKQSIPLGLSFFNQCKNENIDLPAGFLGVPLKIDEIADFMPDLLRSDHAPFWRQGYPAIKITDFANFRTPYYHTPGDTIESLDFQFMHKICQATIASILSFKE